MEKALSQAAAHFRSWFAPAKYTGHVGQRTSSSTAAPRTEHRRRLGRGQQAFRSRATVRPAIRPDAGASERPRPLRVRRLRRSRSDIPPAGSRYHGKGLALPALIVNRLLIRPTEGRTCVPYCLQFTIIDAAGFEAIPEIDGTRSETFIILDFEKRIGIIGGTEYAGEIKKSVTFTVPELPPAAPERDADALLREYWRERRFRAVLRTFWNRQDDALRRSRSPAPLIGDDEHGWSDNGIFNFEGGCYAKCIHLKRETEPEIWGAIGHGAVLENVVLDPATRVPNFDDARLTEIRACGLPARPYSGRSLPERRRTSEERSSSLTADAFGVLPPIARLTTEQAMYYFLSGYTSKLAGTERGITTPQPTFSACFGAPFMPLSPVRYAGLLGQKLEEHSARCFLLNTGWTGGPLRGGQAYGPLCHPHPANRRVERRPRPRPICRRRRIRPPHSHMSCAGYRRVDPFQPRQTWSDPIEYDLAAARLAGQFVENFRKFESVPDIVRLAGSATEIAPTITDGQAALWRAWPSVDDYIGGDVVDRGRD